MTQRRAKTPAAVQAKAQARSEEPDDEPIDAVAAVIPAGRMGSLDITVPDYTTVWSARAQGE